MQDILIIDSNDQTLTTLGDQMLLDGYEVLDARTQQLAHHHLTNSHPDAVIIATLDTPAKTLALLRELRAGKITGADPQIPVLTIGANTDHLAVRHYQAGADIALPSSASPLLMSAGLNALAQREHTTPPRVLRAGNITIDTTTRTTTIDQTRIALTRLEFDVFSALALHPNRIYTKQELYQTVWGYQPAASRTLESHAVRLQHKLKAAGAQPLIQGIRGVGYRLTQ